MTTFAYNLLLRTPIPNFIKIRQTLYSLILGHKQTGGRTEGRTDGRNSSPHTAFSFTKNSEWLLFNILIEDWNKQVECISQPKISKPRCNPVSVCFDVALYARRFWNGVWWLRSLCAPTKQTKLFRPKVGIALFVVNEKARGKLGTPILSSSLTVCQALYVYHPNILYRSSPDAEHCSETREISCVYELNITLRRRKREWRCSYIHSFITFATGWT